MTQQKRVGRKTKMTKALFSCCAGPGKKAHLAARERFGASEAELEAVDRVGKSFLFPIKVVTQPDSPDHDRWPVHAGELFVPWKARISTLRGLVREYHKRAIDKVYDESLTAAPRVPASACDSAPQRQNSLERRLSTVLRGLG